ncbi:hypothetical protein LCGC14_2104800, partial [marine sediment metagenome]
MNKTIDMREQSLAEKILLVDDDVVFTQVLKRALSRLGFEVHTTATAEDAIALANDT